MIDRSANQYLREERRSKPYVKEDWIAALCVGDVDRVLSLPSSSFF
ncbi:MAG: hypothetical protein IJU40_07820 [Desulfovibrionaceae bacterium]|nr:hypothetical protein [Desulfovibrionaceae bacterium]